MFSGDRERLLQAREDLHDQTPATSKKLCVNHKFNPSINYSFDPSINESDINSVCGILECSILVPAFSLPKLLGIELLRNQNSSIPKFFGTMIPWILNAFEPAFFGTRIDTSEPENSRSEFFGDD